MKNIIITGASSGIGLETAKKFLSEGWFVAGTSPDGKIPLEGIIPIKLDYLDRESIQSAQVEIQKLGKKFDVLVNNAGIQIEGKMTNVDVGILRKTLEVNLIGPIDFTEKLIPVLAPETSHIINISSFNASLDEFAEWNYLIPSYRISKTALNMYTKVLAERLKTQGIKVSSLDPGWVRTALGGENAPRSAEEAALDIYNLVISNIPTGEFWFEGKKRAW